MKVSDYILNPFEGVAKPQGGFRTLLECDYADMSPNHGFFDQQAASFYPNWINYRGFISQELARINSLWWSESSKNRAEVLLNSSLKDDLMVDWRLIDSRYLNDHHMGFYKLNPEVVDIYTASVINCFFEDDIFVEGPGIRSWVGFLNSISQGYYDFSLKQCFNERQISAVYFFLAEVLFYKNNISEEIVLIRTAIKDALS